MLSEIQEKLGKQLLGNKWDDLTYYQKMVEIGAIEEQKQMMRDCGHLSLSQQLFGFDLF